MLVASAQQGICKGLEETSPCSRSEMKNIEAHTRATRRHTREVLRSLPPASPVMTLHVRVTARE